MKTIIEQCSKVESLVSTGATVLGTRGISKRRKWLFFFDIFTTVSSHCLDGPGLKARKIKTHPPDNATMVGTHSLRAVA